MRPGEVEREAPTKPSVRRVDDARSAVQFFFAWLAAVVVASATLAVACGSPKRPPVVAQVTLDGGAADAEPPPPPPPPPLYTRLGGKDGVSAIVDAFIDDLMADGRLKKAFAKTKKGPKLDHFKQMLNDQICEITGGGCKYAGKSMPDEHAGMKITSAQFDAFVGDFQLALEEKQVGKDDEKEFLDQLNLLKDQIVAGGK
jgi:hemoglobin